MCQLWEILVPTIRNDGRPIHTRFHRGWDAKVLAITGGLTTHSPAKVQWLSGEGKLLAERMIPVRIACTEEQINRISDLTAAYYGQEAVMFYRVTDKVVVRNYA